MTEEDVPTGAALAKAGPALVILLVVVGAISGQLLGWFDDKQNWSIAALLGLGALGVAFCYQGLYMILQPKAAVEYDVEPPTKYDIDYESTTGARAWGTLAVLAGIVALIGAFASPMLIPE